MFVISNTFARHWQVNFEELGNFKIGHGGVLGHAEKIYGKKSKACHAYI